MKKQVCGILAAFGLMFFLLSAVYYFSYQDLKEQQREELAEGEDAGPGAARLRAGSEQHLLQQ